MNLSEYLDEAQLISHIEEGWVTRRTHDSLPLSILCYSKKTHLEQMWDDITMKCRGLIVHDNGEIIARPFEKFFEVGDERFEETWVTNLPRDTQPLVQEKLDGSLGILYRYYLDDGTAWIEAIASKGSFHSEHAEWASRWYQEQTRFGPWSWPAGYTPVFEMICQEVERHVVQYEMSDQLILLALVHIETGEEMPYGALSYWARLNKIGVAQIYRKSIGEVLTEDRPNAEGYVLSWYQKGQPPLKVKVKHATFLKHKKLKDHMSVKNILELLKNDEADVLCDWQSTTHPELNEFVASWYATLTKVYSDILLKSRERVLYARQLFAERADQAEFFRQTPVTAATCFAMLDGKDFRKSAWKAVEKLTKKSGAHAVSFRNGHVESEEV